LISPGDKHSSKIEEELISRFDPEERKIVLILGRMVDLIEINFQENILAFISSPMD
jgi:hypothetical protein